MCARECAPLEKILNPVLNVSQHHSAYTKILIASDILNTFCLDGSPGNLLHPNFKMKKDLSLYFHMICPARTFQPPGWSGHSQPVNIILSSI